MTLQLPLDFLIQLKGEQYTRVIHIALRLLSLLRQCLLQLRLLRGCCRLLILPLLACPRGGRRRHVVPGLRYGLCPDVHTCPLQKCEHAASLHHCVLCPRTCHNLRRNSTMTGEGMRGTVDTLVFEQPSLHHESSRHNMEADVPAISKASGLQQGAIPPCTTVTY